MSLMSLATAAAQVHSEEPAIDPYVVGGLTLLVLIAMLVGLFAFGKGRDHT